MLMTQAPDSTRARIEALTGIADQPRRDNVTREASFPNLYGLDRADRKAASEQAAVKRAQQVAVQSTQTTPDTSHPASVVVTMLDPTEPRPTRIRVAVRAPVWLAIPLDIDRKVDKRLKAAAILYRDAVQHTASGKGMGTMRGEVVDEDRTIGLLPTERAMSSAKLVRRGKDAMGKQATEGVVNWVIICGGGLRAYDRVKRRRRGTSLGELVDALSRLADEYGT